MTRNEKKRDQNKKCPPSFLKIHREREEKAERGEKREREGEGGVGENRRKMKREEEKLLISFAGLGDTANPQSQDPTENRVFLPVELEEWERERESQRERRGRKGKEKGDREQIEKQNRIAGYKRRESGYIETKTKPRSDRHGSLFCHLESSSYNSR